MKERVQKILSERGVASRRQAEQMIAEGRVCCNGAVCAIGQTADPDLDCITVDGAPIPSAVKPLYIMLNKPKGFVTTLSDEKGRKDVAVLVSDCGQRVYPVGRLDMDSEGLLLFTSDGAFANMVMHPKHQIDKEYEVTVKGYTPQALCALQEPMTLDGYRLAPAKAALCWEREGLAQIHITIHEGRNRQVRRMCARVNMTVKRLVRVREGHLALGDLPAGKWRHLTEDEVKEFYNE